MSPSMSDVTGARAVNVRGPWVAFRSKGNIASGTNCRLHERGEVLAVLHWEMFIKMLGSILNLKVFDAVIKFITVSMMHDFGFQQQTTYRFAHYKAVFRHIAVTRSHGVIRKAQEFVSLIYFPAPVEGVSISPHTPFKMLSSFPSFAHGLSVAWGCHYRN